MHVKIPIFCGYVRRVRAYVICKFCVKAGLNSALQKLAIMQILEYFSCADTGSGRSLNKGNAASSKNLRKSLRPLQKQLGNYSLMLFTLSPLQ